MIKGIQMRTVVLRTPGNPYFEEAHFLMRTDQRNGGSDGDMMTEANRILEECIAEGAQKRRKRKRCGGLSFFLLGALLGGLATAAILLLILL